MARFSFKTNVGDDRTVKIIATWPIDVPELDVSTGDPYDLTTVTEIWFTFKRTVLETDAEALLQKRLTLGDIDIDDDDNNVAYMKLAREDIEDLRPLAADVTYICDVQVRTASGDINTVAEGKWKFLREITQGA